MGALSAAERTEEVFAQYYQSLTVDYHHVPAKKGAEFEASIIQFRKGVETSLKLKRELEELVGLIFNLSNRNNDGWNIPSRSQSR